MRFLSTFLFLFFFILLLHKPIVAQKIDAANPDSSFVDTMDYSIEDYNRYSPLMGGKEIRMRNGKKINGLIKDYYPDSTLKHKGYYTYGQLITVYKNYYPNGSIERSFAVSGNFKSVIQSYYSNGNPKEYLEYWKGQLVKYIDYFPNKNMATFEEHNKRNGRYTVLKNYYSDGTLKSVLELINKKKAIYYQKDYYPSSKLKEEGEVVFNKVYYDYLRQGPWKVYSPKGELVETQEYHQGELVL